MFLFWIFLFTEPNALTITFEELYKPLGPSKVAVGKHQELYVLDSEAMKIHRYDAKGKLLNSFSGPGEGPGELRFPDNLVLFQDAVYVTDFYRGTQVFNLEGEFLYSRKHTIPFVLLDVVEKGWVYEISDAQQGEAEIFWTDADLKESVSLLKYQTVQPEMFFQLSEQGVQVNYHPGQETPTWQIGKDRKELYVFIPGSNNLVVIDLLQKQITGNLPIPLQRQPMNKGWANSQAEKIKSRITLNGKKVSVSVEKTIPDTFPIMSDFFIGPTGNLWLLDGPSMMKQEIHAHVMTPKGMASPSTLPAADAKRIIAISDAMAWFLAFDKVQEKPMIRSVALTHLKAELAKFPNETEDGEDKPIDIRTQ